MELGTTHGLCALPACGNDAPGLLPQSCTNVVFVKLQFVVNELLLHFGFNKRIKFFNLSDAYLFRSLSKKNKIDLFIFFTQHKAKTA